MRQTLWLFMYFNYNPSGPMHFMLVCYLTSVIYLNILVQFAANVSSVQDTLDISSLMDFFFN